MPGGTEARAEAAPADHHRRLDRLAGGRAVPRHRGIRGHRRLRIGGQSGWDRAATSRWRVQRIPADDREVPSFQTRKVIEASPLDPAADLAGALRGLPDRRGLRVVSRSETSQRLQKFALILRRTIPLHAPLRVSDHSPAPVPRPWHPPFASRDANLHLFPTS